MNPRSVFNVFIHDKYPHGNMYFHPFERVYSSGNSELLILLLDALMDDEQKMPHSLCGLLNMPINSSYGDASLKIMSEMGL